MLIKDIVGPKIILKGMKMNNMLKNLRSNLLIISFKTSTG